MTRNLLFISLFFINICRAMEEQPPLELKVIKFGERKVHCCFDPSSNICRDVELIPIKNIRPPMQEETKAKNISQALKDAIIECTIS